MCTQKLTNSQLHLSRRAEERKSNENSRTVMLRRSGAGHQSVDSVLREQRGSMPLWYGGFVQKRGLSRTRSSRCNLRPFVSKATD